MLYVHDTLAAADAQPACASVTPHWQPTHVDLNSSARAKVALFRSLFRGRDDLYARRFESTTTGKSGYAPACANEWVRGICRKPQIKCADCAHRAFLPMTDPVVYWHLCGHAPGEPPRRPFVAGVYPLLEDETCFFLAADFDKAGCQMTPERLSRRAAACICLWRWSDHVRGKVATSGYSSRLPCRLQWHDGSGPTC